MNIDTAESLFAIYNENEQVPFARIPRCVILDKDLSWAARSIYSYLVARCCNQDKPFTWISQKTISKDLDISVPRANEHLKMLQARGLIAIKKQPGANRNVYMIRNVVDVYGEKAKAPWNTRDEDMTADIDESLNNQLAEKVNLRKRKDQLAENGKTDLPKTESKLKEEKQKNLNQKNSLPTLPVDNFQPQKESESRRGREEEIQEIILFFEERFRKVSLTERVKFAENMEKMGFTKQELLKRIEILADNSLLKVSTSSPNRVFYFDEATKWLAAASSELKIIAESPKSQILGQFCSSGWSRQVLGSKFAQKCDFALPEDVLTAASIASFGVTWNQLDDDMRGKNHHGDDDVLTTDEDVNTAEPKDEWLASVECPF